MRQPLDSDDPEHKSALHVTRRWVVVNGSMNGAATPPIATMGATSAAGAATSADGGARTAEEGGGIAPTTAGRHIDARDQAHGDHGLVAESADSVAIRAAARTAAAAAAALNTSASSGPDATPARRLGYDGAASAGTLLDAPVNYGYFMPKHRFETDRLLAMLTGNRHMTAWSSKLIGVQVCPFPCQN